MKYYTFLLLAAFCFSGVIAQEAPLELTAKDSIVVSSWMVGLGFNAVDDSGDVLGDLVKIKEEWNMVPYPSRISLGRYFKSGIGLEGIASYNKYKEGKVIDGEINLRDVDYYALDARLSYDLNKAIGETGWFDPYVGVGLGYTDANKDRRGTYNAVIGFRAWLSERIGIDLNSTGKWSIGSENGATNHLQHALGVVYQFKIEKALSKNGEEKLALIEALEEEKQRQLDSITQADAAREANLLAAQLEKEKAAANEKKLADAKREKAIKSRIANIGTIYFDLNKSAITNTSSVVLDSLVTILKEYPALVINVTSHTDSRGSSAYNDMLSQRRVDATATYLTSRGVDSTQLIPEAFGEQKLLNECDDNTPCSEEKHRMNRRSEFLVNK